MNAGATPRNYPRENERSFRGRASLSLPRTGTLGQRVPSARNARQRLRMEYLLCTALQADFAYFLNPWTRSSKLIIFPFTRHNSTLPHIYHTKAKLSTECAPCFASCCRFQPAPHRPVCSPNATFNSSVSRPNAFTRLVTESTLYFSATFRSSFPSFQTLNPRVTLPHRTPNPQHVLPCSSSFVDCTVSFMFVGPGQHVSQAAENRLFSSHVDLIPSATLSTCCADCIETLRPSASA